MTASTPTPAEPHPLVAVPLSFWLQCQQETFRNQSEKPKEKEEKENE